MTTQTTRTTLRTALTLALSPGEADVVKLHVGAALEIDKGQPKDERLVLRFTGAWARCQPLGTPRVDNIGIGINVG